MSFILVFALSSAAMAAPIDVNNYSFEYDPNGDRIPGHTGFGGAGVVAWQENGDTGYTPADEGYAGVDVMCPYANSTHCHRWPGPTDPNGTGTDVVYAYLQHYNNTNCYQILDMNNSDANAVITAGRRYTLTFDALVGAFDESGNKVKAILFYLADPCFPDVNHTVLASTERTILWIDRPLGDCAGTSILDDPTQCPDWNKNLKTDFVAFAGQSYIGKTLGIKLQAVGNLPTNWTFVDNIRLAWQWATQAWSPNPDDGATEVSKNAILKWNKGGWAKNTGGHDVYFGTAWADVNSATTATATIFKGNQDANNYDPPGAMTLGKTYYWRIDEVNAGYVPGPVPYPPDGKWKGEIWSFTVEGRAKNPYPADGANDVPKNVVLKWMSGADCKYHDVYFGTSESAVEAATTATSGIYKTRINRTTEEWQEYDPVAANPQVGKWYFWRIDEVNTLTVKGYVWGFKVANWILIDDFDFYANATVLNTKWKPVDVDTTYLIVNKDANFAVDNNSMQFEYTNDNPSYYAEAKRTYSTVQDWSYAGNSVTCLEINFFGDANNNDGGSKVTRLLDPPMYAKLSDGTKTAQVNYPDINDCIEEWQHTWNIPLKNYSDKGVTLSKISTIILGMGDGKNTGGKQELGTIYFDDITVRPPRCVLDYAPAGDITEDCTVDNADLDIMATDWLLIDGEALTETQDGTLTNFTTGQWVAGHTGNALNFDGVDDYVLVNDPHLNGLTSMSITCWVKPRVANDWVGLVCSREAVGCGDDGSELGLYGKAYGGPDGIGYDWSCESEEWNFDAGLDDPNNGVWTFCALSVDPCGASLYKREAGKTLKVGLRNAVKHAAQQNFVEIFWIGMSKPDEGYFDGAIDDVRIYGYALSFADVNNLANQIADPNPWPAYWYKFDEASGTTAADSGVPVIVYGPVPSKANLTDPEPKLQRSVNFRDYAILADEWLVETLWPQP